MGPLSFLYPTFLYGAFAAAIPVIIHLIHRRKVKILPFPAVRFILLAQKRLARKYRIKQWLLLALRMLLILLLALALAQPILQAEPEGGVVRPASLARVIILDNSMSMEYRGEAGTRWEEAKRVAQAWITDLRPQDRGALLPAIGEEEAPLNLSFDRDRLLQTLSRLQVRYREANFVPAFTRAYQGLQGAGEATKEIVLITDMTRVPWVGFELERFSVIDPTVKIKIIDLSTKEEEGNTTVSRVHFLDSPVTRGVRTRLQVTLQHHATQRRERVLVQLLIDGKKVDQRLVTLPGRGEKEVIFRVVFPQAGYHLGTVKLAADNLPRDDEFLFSVPVVEEARVLVVDGHPRTALIYSETYYLVNALKPDLFSPQTPIRPKVITTEELVEERLADYQVVVLANVRSLPEEIRARLQQFVHGGGNVIFTLGNQVEPFRYNREWYEHGIRLLPGILRPAHQQGAGQPVRIQDITSQHPALQVFQQQGRESFRKARFWRYFLLDRLSTNSQILLRLADDTPLLLEHAVGQGKVLLFTSSVDLDWNDLALKPVYLPLWQNVVLYLSHGSGSRLGEDTVVGQPVELHLLKTFTGLVRIERPDGKATVWRIRPGEPIAPYAETNEPGVYRVLLSSGAQGLFVVHLPPTESNLAKITLPELESKLQNLPLSVIRWPEKEEKVLLTQVQGTRLAGPLFFLLLWVAVIEGIVANRS